MKTPTERMVRIFEQTVADHNLALHLLNLDNYICFQPLYSLDVTGFNEAIHVKIFSPFINKHDEDIYKKILKFTESLNSYTGFLWMLPQHRDVPQEDNYESVPVSEDEENTVTALEVVLDWEGYCDLWLGCKSHEKMYDRINSDRNKIENMLIKSHNSDEVLTQLDFLHQVFLSHEELHKLFYEITGGKKIRLR